MAQQPGRGRLARRAGQPPELGEHRLLRPGPDPRLDQQGRGPFIRLEFILTRQPRGQKRSGEPRKIDPDAGNEPPEDSRKDNPDRVLAGEVDHPPPGMAMRHVAKFMRDDGCQLIARHLAVAEFPVEPPGQEYPAVGRGEPVDRVDFINVDGDAFQPEGNGQAAKDWFKRGIGQRDRIGVQFLARPPGRELPHQKAIQDGEQDWGQFQHIPVYGGQSLV